MKLLLDHDVYASTARFLRGRGHDVVTAREIGRANAEDVELLLAAVESGRILVTRDRHFGSLVFREELRAGVIYLRLSPAVLEAVHAELDSVLSEHAEDDLNHAFVVVEPGRHRFRRLGG